MSQQQTNNSLQQQIVANERASLLDIDQSLEDLLPIIGTEFDAISKKPIQSSFLARDLVRMYGNISFYRLPPTTITTKNTTNSGSNENLAGKNVEKKEEEEQIEENLNKAEEEKAEKKEEDKKEEEQENRITSNNSSTSVVVIENNNVEEKKDENLTSTEINNEKKENNNVMEEFEFRSKEALDKENPLHSDYLFVDVVNQVTKIFFEKENSFLMNKHAEMNKENEEKKEEIELLDINSFLEIVKSKSVWNDVSKLLEVKYGNEHPVVRYLTLVDQAFVVSLLGHFAEALFFTKTPIRFKDIRGTWKIKIYCYENTISMVHERMEQMLLPIGNTLLKNLFQFSWNVEIIFDNYQLDHISAIHVTLKDIHWDSYDNSLNLTEEKKQEIEKVFLKTFSKHQEPKLPLRISLVDMDPKHLRLLVKNLRQQSKQLVKPVIQVS
ncbi:hypothetical protein ABK040_009062 [Willaertia magna]